MSPLLDVVQLAAFPILLGVLVLGAIYAWERCGVEVRQALKGRSISPDWSRDESAWLREVDDELGRELAKLDQLDRPLRRR